jgi:hypothetical protein
MEMIGNIYPGVCRLAFFERILHTADLTQLLLGFIATTQDLAWYRAIPDDSLQESAFVSKRLVLQQVRPLQCHFQSLIGINWMVIDID